MAGQLASASMLASGRGSGGCRVAGIVGQPADLLHLHLSFPYPFIDIVGAGSEEVLIDDLKVVANASAKGAKPFLPDYTLVVRKRNNQREPSTLPQSQGTMPKWGRSL